MDTPRFVRNEAPPSAARVGAMLAGQACEARLTSAESAIPAACCLLWCFNHEAVVTPPTLLPAMRL